MSLFQRLMQGYDLHLKHLKIFSYILFSYWALTSIFRFSFILDVLSFILLFYCVYVLQKKTHSPTLLKRMIFLFLSLIAFFISCLCVNPLFMLLVGKDYTFEFGVVILIINPPLLFYLARLVFKELALITNEKMFSWCFYYFVAYMLFILCFMWFFVCMNLLDLQSIPPYLISAFFSEGAFLGNIYLVLSLLFQLFGLILSLLLFIAVAKVKELRTVQI